MLPNEIGHFNQDLGWTHIYQLDWLNLTKILVSPTNLFLGCKNTDF